MKKAILVIPEDNFRDEELFETRAVLEQAGLKVEVASTSLKEARGRLGGSCKPDILLSEVKIAQLEMLVFIGGPGTVQYWDDPLAQRLVREAAESQKVLGAICIAPVILARAGMLKGRRATAWPSPEDEEELKKAGAEFSAQPVERDGNIVTANGPDAARQFARQLLRALGE